VRITYRELFVRLEELFSNAGIRPAAAMADRVVRTIVDQNLWTVHDRQAIVQALRECLPSIVSARPETLHRIASICLDTSSTVMRRSNLYIPITEIDAFKKAEKIKRIDVNRVVPLDLHEAVIKKAFAEIIGEPFVPTDWGGEQSDLFTTRLKVRRRRIRAAFLFKGRGTRGPLYISGLGKRGDQIIRLLREPADLVVLQHINVIDSNVLNHLESEVMKKQAHGTVWYSTCDGQDTARILLAYGWLCGKCQRSRTECKCDLHLRSRG